MKTCIVDSYGIVGTELNIDVALNSNKKPIPYISYYTASKPKIARWADTVDLTADTLGAGAVEDVFTGNWEVSYIPTSTQNHTPEKASNKKKLPHEKCRSF